MEERERGRKGGGNRKEGSEGTCMLSPITESSSGWLELLRNVFPLATEPVLS